MLRGSCWYLGLTSDSINATRWETPLANKSHNLHFTLWRAWLQLIVRSFRSFWLSAAPTNKLLFDTQAGETSFASPGSATVPPPECLHY